MLFKSEESRRTFDRLTANCSPLKDRLAQYAALAKPPKHKLGTDKSLRIITTLLPDIERGAITWKGRDWAAPLSAWAQAIDQMLAQRDAGRLELPMKGHGYLYAILAGMADRFEGQAEQQREHELRTGPRAATAPTRRPTTMKLYAFPQASLEKAIAKRMLGLGAPHREWFAERWSQKPYKKSFIELKAMPLVTFLAKGKSWSDEEFAEAFNSKMNSAPTEPEATS